MNDAAPPQLQTQTQTQAQTQTQPEHGQRRSWSAAFAADLHLAPRDAAGLERAAELVRLCARNTRRLFLLGDVFDLWTSGAELRLDELAPLIATWRAARRNGLVIEFLAGNRDFNLSAADGSALGVDVLPTEELEVTLGGRRFVLLHGDQLLLEDHAYQRMKRVVRSRPLRFLARHLPAPLSLAAARRLRRFSETAVPQKLPGRLRIVHSAVRARLRQRPATVMCGHVHRCERIDFGGGSELVVLPPFLETASFVALTGSGLAQVSLKGALSELPASTLADPP